jgi:membrane protein implicated in regulation of membrane protease activity
MRTWPWSRRTILKYALYQAPSYGLLILIFFLVNRWMSLPAWFIWGGVAVWVAKDVILFPFVWRAYDRDRSKDVHPLINRQGIVERRLDPSGYVWIHGELWRAEKAEGGPPIEQGETVVVRGNHGLVLLVEANAEGDRQR